MNCNKTKEYDNYTPSHTACDNFKAAKPTLPKGAIRLGDLKAGDLWICAFEDKSPDISLNSIKCVRFGGRSYYLSDNELSGITDSNIPVYRIKATYELMK